MSDRVEFARDVLGFVADSPGRKPRCGVRPGRIYSQLQPAVGEVDDGGDPGAASGVVLGRERHFGRQQGACAVGWVAEESPGVFAAARDWGTWGWGQPGSP